MTDEEAEALGRRLLAAGCPWRAGMLGVDYGRGCEECDRRGLGWTREVPPPDLRDAATRGAVLEALRERTGLWLYTEPRPWVQDPLAAGDPVQWFVCKMGGLPLYSGDGSTEQEALVLAWEEAPSQRRQ